MISRRWLVAAIVIGAGLRFLMLGHQSFWYDEVVSAKLAAAGLGDIVHGRVRDLGNPPFHLIFLHLWESLFGTSDAALRASSALISLLSIPVVFSVGKRLLGEETGLMGAFIFALSPVQIYFAQETRTYALVTLLCLLSTDLLLRALDGKNWAWIVYAVTVFLSMYSHYFSAFVIFAHIGFVLLCKREKMIILRALGAYVAAGLMFLVWLPSLIAQVTTKGNLGRSAETWYLHVAATPLVFSVGTTLVWKGEASKLRLLLGALALASFGLAALAGAWALRKNREPFTLLLLWFLLPIALPVLVSVTLFPLYNVRYALIASPAFYLLMAAGLRYLYQPLRAALIIGMAVTAAASLAFYFTRLVKHDWRDASAYVTARLQPGDVMAFDADIGETAFAHYAGRDTSRVRLLPLERGQSGWYGSSSDREPAHHVEAQLANGKRVWFVFSDPSSGAGNYYKKKFGDGWTQLEEKEFRGIEVHLYDQNRVLK